MSYILFCESEKENPDRCYLRLINTDTNRITVKRYFTLFSLIQSSNFDLLTDNYIRQIDIWHEWTNLENYI